METYFEKPFLAQTIHGLEDNKRNKVLKLMFSGQSVGTVIVGDVG